MTTPAGEGLRMPAEWEPQSRCWMGWPGGGLDEEALESARHATVEVARAIAAFEPVVMLCATADAADVSLALGAGIQVLPTPFSDHRLRDRGPSFVSGRDGRRAGVVWGRGDGAGEGAIADRILEHLKMERFAVSLGLGGAGLAADGEGTLFASEEELLDPTRSLGLSREEIERQLKDHLGVSTLIWLGGGPAGGGRLDAVICPLRPGVVLALTTEDPADANFKAFQDNLDRLKRARDAQGRELEVVAVAQPAGLAASGLGLALSYTSLCLINGAVIMPAFEDNAADAEAYRLLRRAFPERAVIQLPALDIVRAAGGLHRLVRTQPAEGGPAG